MSFEQTPIPRNIDGDIIVDAYREQTWYNIAKISDTISNIANKQIEHDNRIASLEVIQLKKNAMKKKFGVAMRNIGLIAGIVLSIAMIFDYIR